VSSRLLGKTGSDAGDGLGEHCGSTTGEISPSEASCSRNRVFRRFARLKMSSNRAPMAGLPEARYPTAIEQNYAVLNWIAETAAIR
jgi:hypothetical protein